MLLLLLLLLLLVLLIKADFHPLKSGRAVKTTSMISYAFAVMKISADTYVERQAKTCTLRSDKRTNHISVYTYNNTMIAEASTR